MLKLFLLLLISLGISASEVKLLNWWDFIYQQNIERLKKHGHQINLTVYKSNDVAVSKLLQQRKNYDVAIISNGISSNLINSGLIKKGTFKTEIKNRNYNPSFIEKTHSCIPYLWSATIFTIHKDKKSKAFINDLTDTDGLIKNKTPFGLVDDKLEVWGRTIIDTNPDCAKKKSFVQLEKCYKPDEIEKLNLKRFQFYTSTEVLLKKNNTAAYGWHGEFSATETQDKTVELDFILPKNRLITGMDMVCIVNNKYSPKKLKQLKKFILILTDKTSTEISVKESQYFSPYMNHTKGLKKKVKELYIKIQDKIKKEEPLFISSPSAEYHNTINSWWMRTRYK